MDKATLRRKALARRARTTPEERLQAGKALVKHFPAQLLRRATDQANASPITVAAYVSMGSEIETRPLLAWLLASECRTLVPRLGAGLDIGWSILDSMASLRQIGDAGHLRPDEPTGEVLPPDALEEADLVIAPALGVDRHGHRLGRGAGWYDQALAECRSGCPMIAVCWSWEVLSDADLPAEPHDIPADGVLTPEGYQQIR